MNLSVDIQWIIFQICDDVEIAMKRQKLMKYLDKITDLNKTL